MALQVSDNSSTEMVVCASNLASPADLQYLAPFKNEKTVGLFVDKKPERCEAGSYISGDMIRFYDMHHPIGCALLLGSDRHYLQQPAKNRLCVEKDQMLMNDVLEGHGWSISSANKQNGTTYLTSLQWDNCIEELLVTNFDQYSCFLFYYTGHGNEKGVLLGDGSCKSYVNIVEVVSSIDSLDHKPKIFIFDSCRIREELSSENHFSEEIDVAHNEARSSHYPPPDTIICHSACEGKESFACDSSGSFYTQLLSRIMEQFMEHITFSEVVTLTHGWVKQLAMENDKVQHPMMYCALNNLLVLGVRDERNEEFKILRDPSRSTAQLQIYVDKSECVYIKGKGPGHSVSSTLVEKDGFRDSVRKRIQFKSKADVVSNLQQIGQGVSAFVCYAPDPDSPYHDPGDRQDVIAHNQMYITHLIHDLERLGFTVISDLHLGETQPKNWLQWYVSRMELCDYLIMVCSPAFKELFSCDKPKYHITDERTSWFLAYRSIMYADIVKEMKESSDSSKFLPVILGEQYLADDSVPALFQMAPLYQLGSEGHRKFNYDNMTGAYERLVCRMAGIDRIKIEAPADKGVLKVAAPYSQKPGVSGRYTGAPSRKRPGYKSIPWKPSTDNSTTSEQPPPTKQPNLSACAQPSPTSQSSPQILNPPHEQPLIPPMNASPPFLPPPPSTLPDRPPSRSVILWLCERVTNWRVLARFLGFDRAEIERIAVDHDTVVEQRFQMFDSWQRHETREYSYRTLGDVLWNSESNRHLYREFYQKVMSSE